MKQSKERDCKIVQDLLPNYIEELTNEITNEFIEKHVETCRECKKAIQDITGKFEVEELNQEEEINYLKKLNKKVKMKIVVVSLIVIIIASSISIYVYNKSKIRIGNYTFMRAEYMIENQEGTNDGNLYCTLVAVIDEKNICKGVRVVEKGYTEENLDNRYQEVLQENKEKGFPMNVEIINEELHYNINVWNGYDKEMLRKKLNNSYKLINIEGI